MKIVDNGIERDMTPEEIAAHELLCEQAAEANAKTQQHLSGDK